MKSAFARLSRKEKIRVLDWAWQEYDRLTLQTLPTGEIEKIQAEPDKWVRERCEAVASDSDTLAQVLGKTQAAGKREGGFTLIELSVVLVIIGLLIGSVLVGKDLIRAAEARGTISQLEKFNTAANTFRGKYGYLPGDIKDPDATRFGFIARGPGQGQGDGNGVIEGWNPGLINGTLQNAGETTVFWVDLSTARMIEGGFSTASTTSQSPTTVTLTTNPSIRAYFPEAKMGRGNYFYAYSGGVNTGDGTNYFGISGIRTLVGFTSFPSLTVQQAYDIDRKMDDGYPQTGNVTAVYVASNPPGAVWVGASPGAAASASSTSCYDNGNSASSRMQYSLGQSGGAGVNCSLSFRFQ